MSIGSILNFKKVGGLKPPPPGPMDPAPMALIDIVIKLPINASGCTSGGSTFSGDDEYAYRRQPGSGEQGNEVGRGGSFSQGLALLNMVYGVLAKYDNK